MSILVSVDDLRRHQEKGRKATIIASFTTEDEGSGPRMFAACHIPNALFCDPRTVMAGTPSRRTGRNPLPDFNRFAEWIRRTGIRDDRPTVIYGYKVGHHAARLWWLLRWAGVKDVRLLDGNLAAWMKAGYATLNGPGPLGQRSDIALSPGNMPVADIDDVRNFTGVLIDARDEERFAGKREGVDLKAGHIPGAVNIPAERVIRPDGTSRAPELLRELFHEAGVTDGKDVIVYSGSGRHSARVIAAMEIAGITGAAHYIGGWSQWAANPSNPAELGL